MFFKYEIISNVNNIQKQIDNRCITEVDMLQVNKMDSIITKYMLQTEKIVKILYTISSMVSQASLC